MIEYFILGFSILNSILLIGIAGSLAKMIRSFSEEPVQMSRERETIDLSGRPPNYAELAISNPQLSRSNWDGLTVVPKNWDGVPRQKE